MFEVRELFKIGRDLFIKMIMWEVFVLWLMKEYIILVFVDFKDIDCYRLYLEVSLKMECKYYDVWERCLGKWRCKSIYKEVRIVRLLNEEGIILFKILLFKFLFICDVYN